MTGAPDRRAWRDAAGRPVAPGSPHAVEQVPDVARAPDVALDLAQQLLDAGRPFSAHDVLEGVWKAAPVEQRALWQGLAQVCVGLTHDQRDNPVGATRLLRRGAGLLADAATAYGVEPARVAARAVQVADDVEAGRTGDRSLRLRR